MMVATDESVVIVHLVNVVNTEIRMRCLDTLNGMTTTIDESK